MNKINAHLYLPFVQALVDGKTLQLLNVANEWVDIRSLDANDLHVIKRVRVKPEPLECWIALHYDHMHIPHAFSVSFDLSDGEKFIGKYPTCKLVHMLAVL